MKLEFNSKKSKVAAELGPLELIILVAFFLLLCAIILFAPHGLGVKAVTSLIKVFRH